uniref:Uncharacterized protein n=1 Tax=Candidatus Kentrum sp. LFY TaxID=2126342 RepID=A0A450V3Z5_9GAMM|nr:MAG: hypothetical protein BECKLFY1418A_GA0070994_11003 [Candidatus Kentron sp. LFY]
MLFQKALERLNANMRSGAEVIGYGGLRNIRFTTMVAKNIFELEGAKYITLENGSRDVLDAAGARGRGR